MESQPQNPEFRNNPANFYPCNSFVTSLKHGIGYYKVILWPPFFYLNGTLHKQL